MASRRWVSVGCTHGYYIDERFKGAFLEWLADYDPQIRIHLGDAWDFESIRGGATDEDKALGLAADIEAGNSFLRELFRRGEERVLLRGNHDERLWKLKDSANGIRREYAQSVCQRLDTFVRDELGAIMRPYHVTLGAVRFASLVFIHGISFAKAAGQIHANAYCRPGDTVVYAHTHTVGHGAVEQWPRPKYWLNCGCGRTLVPSYAERRIATLRWEHAWAYGEVRDDGTATAHLFTLQRQEEET